MFLLFNTLSRFVIASLPRSSHLLISWQQSPSAVILEPKKRKSITAPTFPPSICHDFSFFNIDFWASFFTLPSLSSRGLLVPLHFLPFRVVSSAYLRPSMFPPPMLIPAYNSSSLACLMMCSVYKLNKQGDNRQPCCTPLSILNQSVIPYRVLTVASWPAYRFYVVQYIMVHNF